LKQIKIGGMLEAPCMALGCMRINRDAASAAAVINKALELGINYFDHADIYGGGRSEEMFAKATGMRPDIREKFIIQTKCSIRSGSYDFSKEHILSSVDGSLKRLNTDYIDVLLLHRPDTLMEPEEVAEAFDILQSSGKVRHFGVSNHNPYQIELLKTCVKQPLIIDQLQFGPVHTGMINSGINVNTTFDGSVDRDGSVLEYCRIKGITIQPWSPFQHGFIEGSFMPREEYKPLMEAVGELAKKYEVPDTAIIVAWMLRHPAKMQPIVGTTNPNHLEDMAKGADITLTREEWYKIYIAGGNDLP